MIASKVSVSQETLAKLNSPAVSKGKQRKIKIQAVKEYIRSKPSGTIITQDELMAEAGYDPRMSKRRVAGAQFIYQLGKKGIIKPLPVSGRYGTYSYCVPGDAKVTVPAPKAPVKEEKQLTWIANAEQVKSIESMARDYSWNKDSDSLRGFINYIKQGI